MSKTLLAAVLLLFAIGAHATVYKCKDANGKTIFSDIPCGGVEQETISTGRSNAPASPDESQIVQACFSHLKRSAGFFDPDSAKIESHLFSWVTVKDIGARRIVFLMINAKNRYGGYVGAQPKSCVLMGDGQTINTGAYELQ